MNFILYNNLSDKIIIWILIINSIITGILFSKEESNKEKKEENLKIDNISLYKKKIILFYKIILLIIAIYLIIKLKLLSYFIIPYYLFILYSTHKMKEKNITELTYENKMTYIQTITLYAIFFSSFATKFYTNNFKIESHIIMEYMLLLFITIKLIFLIYCLIINFSIFISNFRIIFKKQLNNSKIIINKLLNKSYKINQYSFKISTKIPKNKKILIIDILIYTILCPIIIIINFTMITLQQIYKLILKKLIQIDKKILDYLNNSSKMISKTLKISKIISMILVCIIATNHKEIISSEVKEIYILISTVTLIPLIYDKIKNNF